MTHLGHDVKTNSQDQNQQRTVTPNAVRVLGTLKGLFLDSERQVGAREQGWHNDPVMPD